MTPVKPPNLDDRRFEKIVEELRKRMPCHSPEWTDSDEHDVGILLSQLAEHAAAMDRILADLAERLRSLDGKAGDERPFRRVHYFDGRFVSAEDFQAEQQYFNDKLKQHNRCVHGYGVVSGLKVSVVANIMRVCPGVALDCAGNEIVVCKPVEMGIPEQAGDVYVNLYYRRCRTDVEATSPEPCGTEEGGPPRSRVRESPEIIYELDCCCCRHERDSIAEASCEQPQGLSISRLRRRRNRWKVDRRFLPPRVR